MLNEEGDRDGEDNTVVNHGKVQNAYTQCRGHKWTFLTPNETKKKKSKYHHPSFYSQSIAKTKRPCTCTMKKNRCEVFFCLYFVFIFSNLSTLFCILFNFSHLQILFFLFLLTGSLLIQGEVGWLTR